MVMMMNTCSEVVSLARELEKQAAKFYLDISASCAEGKEMFLGFAKDNEDYVTLVERAYYGVISDAYEGCFAFNMNPEAHRIDTDPPKTASPADAAAKALAIEEKMIQFYQEASEQSKSLMADVPRAMKQVARKRGDRLAKLRALLGK